MVVLGGAMARVGLPVSSDVSDGCMGFVEGRYFPLQVAEVRARARYPHRLHSQN